MCDDSMIAIPWLELLKTQKLKLHLKNCVQQTVCLSEYDFGYQYPAYINWQILLTVKKIFLVNSQQNILIFKIRYSVAALSVTCIFSTFSLPSHFYTNLLYIHPFAHFLASSSTLQGTSLVSFLLQIIHGVSCLFYFPTFSNMPPPLPPLCLDECLGFVSCCCWNVAMLHVTGRGCGQRPGGSSFPGLGQLFWPLHP